MNRFRKLMRVSLCSIVVAAAGAAAAVAQTTPVTTSATPTTTPSTAPASQPVPLEKKYEKVFAAFDAQDKAAFPKPGGTLFIGSSTITRWKQIPEVFKEFRAINRGFGGSVIGDMLAVLDRYVLPYKPAAIVLYCGSNDLSKRSPEDVVADTRKFCEKVHAKLPETKIYYLSVKQNIRRASQHEIILKTNALMVDYVKTEPSFMRYVDINTLVCDEKGQPKREFLADDLLHPNDKGYEVTVPVIKAALETDGFGKN